MSTFFRDYHSCGMDEYRPRLIGSKMPDSLYDELATQLTQIPTVTMESNKDFVEKYLKYPCRKLNLHCGVLVKFKDANKMLVPNRNDIPALSDSDWWACISKYPQTLV